MGKENKDFEGGLEDREDNGCRQARASGKNGKTGEERREWR